MTRVWGWRCFPTGSGKTASPTFQGSCAATFVAPRMPRKSMRPSRWSWIAACAPACALSLPAYTATPVPAAANAKRISAYWATSGRSQKVLPLAIGEGELGHHYRFGWLEGRWQIINDAGRRGRKAGGVATVGWCYAVSAGYGAGDVSQRPWLSFGFCMAATAVVCCLDASR